MGKTEEFRSDYPTGDSATSCAIAMYSQEYGNQLYAEYSKERDKLNDASLETAGRYDRAVLTISTGALALSIGFVEKIAPQPMKYSVAVLGVAWFLLLSAVVFQLLALSASQLATRKQISLLDGQYQQLIYSDDKISAVYSVIAIEENIFAKKVALHNTVSLWSLVSGIILVMVFSTVNILSK